MRGSGALAVLIASAAALLLRVVYLFDARGNPLWRHLGLDLQIYDDWARRIAAGHGLGEAPFTQAPFFPVALGATYAILGKDPVRALWVHSLVGAATAALVAVAGWRWRGALAGAVAGLLVALEKPAIFYTGVLLPPVWSTFLVALTIVLFQNAWLTGRHHALAGIALGFATLAQPTVLPLGLVAAGAVVLRRSFEPSKSLGRAAAFGLGVVAVLAATFFYNGIAGGAWTPVAVNGGVNLYIGNNPDATGAYTRPPGLREDRDLLGVAAASAAVGRTLSPTRASAYWNHRALGFIASHPARWLGLMGKKFFFFFSNLEIPQVEFLGFETRYSTLLKLPLPGMAFVLALAVFGAALLLRRDTWARVLAACVLAIAAGVSLFFITARFRLVALPFLALLAGGAIDAARSASRRQVAGAALAGAAVFALALTNPFAVGLSESEGQLHFRLAVSAQREGRPAEALAEYGEAVRLMPHLARAHMNMGALLASEGRLDEARPHLEEAARLDPGNAQTHFNLARLRHATGDAAGALEEYSRTLALDPSYMEARDGRATILYEAGRVREAAEDWSEIARGAPSGENGARARFFLGLFAARAADSGWEQSEVLRHGDLSLAEGDRASAQSAYNEVARGGGTGSESAKAALERLPAQ